MKTALEIIDEEIGQLEVVAAEIQAGIDLQLKEHAEITKGISLLQGLRERFLAEGNGQTDKQSCATTKEVVPSLTVISERPKSNVELITEFVATCPGSRAADISTRIAWVANGQKTKGAISCAISTMISKGQLYRDDEQRIYASKAACPVKLTTPPESSYLDRIVTFLSVSGPSTIEGISEGTGIGCRTVNEVIETAHITFVKNNDRYSIEA